MKIHALHGFLGTPNDWSFLVTQLADNELVNYSVFNASPIIPFKAWARNFNQQIDDAYPILLGYSLGGRLAMNALMDAPDLWKGAIIVSGHLGLKSQQEKEARYISDCEWAERFRTEEWDQLLHHWNAREMFTTASFAFDRKESDYNREHLAKAISTWSLGNQAEMTQFLAELSIPVLWIAGKNDLTYKARAKQVSFKHHLSRVWIAPDSGHRVPWEQQQSFTLQLQQFLNDIRIHNEHYNTCPMGNC